VLSAGLLFALQVFGAGAAPSPPKGKAKTHTAGSHKCEKGPFESLSKDATIPLCDAHYPDDKAKSAWLILFYKKDAEHGLKVHDKMNRVAVDMGNEPPEKSKALKKLKKQRVRIKDLAEKYEFEAKIPKKGLDEKGKEALLKVGAVCCDCGSEEEKLCEDRGVGVRLVRPGQEDIAMPGDISEQVDEDKMVMFTMSHLGFVKEAGGGKGDSSDKKAEKKAEKKESPKDKEADKKAGKKAEGKKEDKKPDKATPEKNLSDLKAKKAKAVEAEDFEMAKELKKQIEALQKTLEKELSDLQSKKAKAVEEEDFKTAKELKKQIEAAQKKLEL